MEVKKLKSIVAQLLNDGQAVEIKAGGYSMFPLLWPGDVLCVQPLQLPMHPGELVVFDRGDTLVAHRFITIKDDKVICKGDGFATYDHPMEMRQVLGKVVYRLRNGNQTNLYKKRYLLLGKIVLWFPYLTGIGFNLMARLHTHFYKVS